MYIWFGFIWFGLVSHLKLGPGHRHVHSMGVGPPSQVLCAAVEKTCWVQKSFQQCFGSRSIQSEFGSSILDWIPTRIQDFDDQQLKQITVEKNFDIFLIKIAIYLSLGLCKGSPSYRRSLQHTKENIQHCITWNFLFFILFLWVIFALLDPDSDQSPWTWLNPDPPTWSGSGSETLGTGSVHTKADPYWTVSLFDMIKTMSCALFVFSSLFVVCIVDCVIKFIVDLRQPETQQISSVRVSVYCLPKVGLEMKINRLRKYLNRFKSMAENVSCAVLATVPRVLRVKRKRKLTQDPRRCWGISGWRKGCPWRSAGAGPLCADSARKRPSCPGNNKNR